MAAPDPRQFHQEGCVKKNAGRSFPYTCICPDNGIDSINEKIKELTIELKKLEKKRMERLSCAHIQAFLIFMENCPVKFDVVSGGEGMVYCQECKQWMNDDLFDERLQKRG